MTPLSALWHRKTTVIAALSIAGIILHLVLRFGFHTAIFDKTGTLTYGEPKLTEQLIATGFDQKKVLTLVASLERYSKHPLARAILAAAEDAGIQLPEATEVGEKPGQGLRGTVSGHQLLVTSSL